MSFIIRFVNTCINIGSDGCRRNTKNPSQRSEIDLFLILRNVVSVIATNKMHWLSYL